MANYNSINSSQQRLGPNHPYGAGDPYYAESTGFITPQNTPKKAGTSPWIKFGIPVAILIIVGAVVGGVLGSRAANNSSSSNGGSSSGANSDGGKPGKSLNLDEVRFATATNSKYLEPIYPSTTAAAFSTPTFRPAGKDVHTWPKDPFAPANPQPTAVRPDRPRLIAPAYKWAALPELIANDPYLQGWNNTIFFNASVYYDLPPVAYFMDGSSGILDNAREIKMRIKAFSYVYRMTNDTKWVDRVWTEVQNAAGNGSVPFGPAVDRWNTGHFLDTAEFAAAYAIAYDWLYDIWTPEQKDAMRFTVIQYALQPGLLVYTSPATSSSYGWWSGADITGNWNCVSNSGITLAALAILGDDTTGVAEQLIPFTVNNAKQSCAMAVSDDGTWAETANYWYFGTTGHAEMAAGLLTATGSHYGLLDVNPNFYKTGMYHMAVNSPGSLFDYGDHGPNKFSTTANAMFFYATQYNQPRYSLHQRDQHDAAEPWSMFWYDPSADGAWWDNLPLDTFFDNTTDLWASMRSSWTDNNALAVSIKASILQHHQTHNDLDVGDYILDALGTRWAGDLGSANYNSPGYFSSDAQDSQRWMYYRKMTEGQNTILIDRANQQVTASCTARHDSSNTVQGSSTVLDVPKDSTAFWVADMTSAYANATSIKRGMRLLNGRRQALLQDEIVAQGTVDWLMHTNATVTPSGDGTSATLELDGQKLELHMLNPPAGAKFTTGPAVRFPSDVTPPEPDQPNPTVTVIFITLPPGQYSLQVLFNPKWPGMSESDFVTPPSVPLDNWSLTSHN